MTVVVSFSTYGEDFKGGLYVAVNGAQRQVIPLSRCARVVCVFVCLRVRACMCECAHNEEYCAFVHLLACVIVFHVNVNVGAPNVTAVCRGDAIFHSYDLLHGVQVQGVTEHQTGERWSWISWYKDSTTCEQRE